MGTTFIVKVRKSDKGNMKTIKPKEYIAPEVKVIEVIVEQGFLITGIVINDRIRQEKHVVDEVESW